jgi:hypothetical protein
MKKKQQQPMLVTGHDPSEADIARVLLAMDLAGDDYVPALEAEEREKLERIARK